jgi:hypothetical protein
MKKQLDSASLKPTQGRLWGLCSTLGTLLFSAAIAASPAARGQTQEAQQELQAVDEAGISDSHRAVPPPPEFLANARPLLFEPEENGIHLDRPQLRWVIDNGTKINIGGLIIDSGAMAFRFVQTKRDETPKSFREGGDSQLATHVSFQWPLAISKTGRFTLETGDGSKTLFSYEITEKSLAEWKNRLKDAGSKLGKIKSQARSHWGLPDVSKDDFGFLWAGGTFRACLTLNVSEDESMHLCTAPFMVKGKDDKLMGKLAPTPQEPTVQVAGQDIGPRGIVTFPDSKPILLRVFFKGGALVEIKTRPIELKLIDAVENADGSAVVLTGEGAKPAGQVIYLQRPSTHFWSATGVPQRTIWRVTIPRQSPTVRALGAFNIPFTFLFRAEDLPKESDRLYVAKRAEEGTYSSEPVLDVMGPGGATVTSNEKAVQLGSHGVYSWIFAAPNVGTENKAHIMVKTSTDQSAKPWVAYHEMYRAYPYELSGRLTGVATSGRQTVLLVEAAGASWFEGLFGNGDWSFHRWGLAGRYFQATSSMKISADTSVSQFSALNLDLKYSFVRGMWNRDELFGAMLSTEMVTLGPTKANFLGGGAYWARTMPKVFDDIFNYLPFMKYPKYVDMEFIMYPMSLTSGITAGSTMNLNFHGKVFWTPRLFGEAGFGMKRFVYTDSSQGMDVTLNTFYGTVGLGLLF